MSRCIQLALLGEGAVAPNPMVGALLVHDKRVIGEGYHTVYVESHAEVNCLNSVISDDQPLIPASTLYVSLEPCAHFGKTPPCADLIVKSGIKKVVVAARDPFPRVNGMGIEILKQAGVEVVTGVLEEQAMELNKIFFFFQQKKRPYIFLKWAQTVDGFIAAENYQQVAISNALSNRWVHKLRSSTQAILVGTNTAVHDNPSLTTRLWTGESPLRIVIDKQLRVPATSALFSSDAPLLVFNLLKDETAGHVRYIKVTEGDDLLRSILKLLYNENIQSLLVEGGAVLLRSFIEQNLWDEAIIITNKSLQLGSGIPSVKIPHGVLQSELQLGTDDIRLYKNPAA